MKQCQRWCTGEAQMRDNPEGGELGPAEGVSAGAARRISHILSYIGKRRL